MIGFVSLVAFHFCFHLLRYIISFQASNPSDSDDPCASYDKWMALSTEEKNTLIAEFYCAEDESVSPGTATSLENRVTSDPIQGMSCDDFNIAQNDTAADLVICIPENKGLVESTGPSAAVGAAPVPYGVAFGLLLLATTEWMI